MKKIVIISIFISFLVPQFILAARLFPGESNQNPITENGGLCLPEGEAVWFNQGYQCCDGLTSHLQPNTSGQPSCQPYSIAIMQNIFLNDRFYFGLIILIIALAIVIAVRRKRRKRREINN